VARDSHGGRGDVKGLKGQKESLQATTVMEKSRVKLSGGEEKKGKKIFRVSAIGTFHVRH
jgi:aspartate aminotransferase-like enzyme